MFAIYLLDPIWRHIPFDSYGYFSKLQYNAWVVQFPATVLLTMFVARLSFRYIESPILKLKDKYFRYRGAATTVTF